MFLFLCLIVETVWFTSHEVSWSLEKPLLKGYSWKNSKFLGTKQFRKYVILMLFNDTGSNEDVIWHQIRCKCWMESKRKNVIWHTLRRNYFKEMVNTEVIWECISCWGLNQTYLKQKSNAFLPAQWTTPLWKNDVRVLVPGKDILNCCKLLCQWINSIYFWKVKFS